ncbi:MAG: tetratricopeptide repeat protein [Rhodothermales bacterium]
MRRPNLTGFFLVALLAAATGFARPAGAQVSEAVLAFDQGNQLYRDGQYEQAIAAYQSAIDQGYASGALYFNMGNAYYRLDRIGQAIRYYEKSRRLTPESAELLHSLEIARGHTVDQFSHVPQPVWVAWWHSHITRTGGRGLLWGGLLLYFVAAGLFAGRILRGWRNPWLRRLRAVTTLAATVLLVAAFAASIQSTSERTAVVVATQTALRDAPLETSGTELTIHEGLVVDVLGNADAWAEVRLPNGTRGWVETSALADV